MADQLNFEDDKVEVDPKVAKLQLKNISIRNEFLFQSEQSRAFLYNNFLCCFFPKIHFFDQFAGMMFTRGKG